MNHDQDKQPAAGERKLPGGASAGTEQPAQRERKEKPAQDAASAADKANPPRGPQTSPRGVGATEREAPASQGSGEARVSPASQRGTGPLQNDARHDRRGVE